jgi:toxin ParE1/3/4
MMPVRFLPQAEAELLHEVEYYSRTGSETGIRFQAAVEASLERVSRHPLGGAPSPNGTRSVLIKGFPFSIIYRATDIELLVVAIAAHRRRPGYWMPRVV